MPNPTLTEEELSLVLDGLLLVVQQGEEDAGPAFDLREQLRESQAEAEQDTDAGAPPETIYPTYVEWIEDWLAPVYEQLINAGRAWCPEWWRHPGAIARLIPLWESWEAAMEDGGSSAAYWFVKIGDPMMNELARADGTFRGCKDYAEGRTATKWLINGETWEIEDEPQDRLVEQQAPEPRILEDGTKDIRMPKIEGVDYRRRDLHNGNVVITAHAKPGCRLQTGHKVERPHPRGELPTTTP